MTDYIFTVEGDRACLDGHFPGHPIVPGIVILEHVGHAVARRYSGRITRIVRCKFVAALYPDQSCRIELMPGASARMQFSCSGPDGCVAHGLVEWEAGDDG